MKTGTEMSDDNISPRKHILYVEDDPEMVDLVRLILIRQGYSVAGAYNGKDGLLYLENNLPDLILLDLMMPDMDGWEVYHKIKSVEITANIPIIIITAKSQPIDRVLGLHIAKVDDYLSKPFRPQELLDCVENVLTRI